MTRTFILGCITGASVAVCVLALTATRWVPPRFDEITVGRINVVEPDGTLRMVLSSRARFPGSFVQGKEIVRPDRRAWAGMIFVNDEGTENGGLIQQGRITPDGGLESGLSLTFDRFRQDQMLQLRLDEDDRAASAGVVVNDQPNHRDFSIADAGRLVDAMARLSPAERDALRQREAERGHLGARRAYLGTERDGQSMLDLRDPKGRPRLRLSVDAQGAGTVQWLDEQGRVVRRMSANGAVDRGGQ